MSRKFRSTWFVLSLVLLSALIIAGSSRSGRPRIDFKLAGFVFNSDGERVALLTVSNATDFCVERLPDYSTETDGRVESRGNSADAFAKVTVLAPKQRETVVVKCPDTPERWRVQISCRRVSGWFATKMNKVLAMMARLGIPVRLQTGEYQVTSQWIESPESLFD